MAFSYKQLGNVSPISATNYTTVGTGVSGRKWQGMAHIANLTASAVTVRLYLADNSFADGAAAPTGGTLAAQLAFDVSVPASGVLTIGPFHLDGNNKLVVKAGTATALSIHAFGVEES